MELILAMLICVGALIGGALLAMRISSRTGFTLAFAPWFVCFIGAFMVLRWTPLLNAYTPYGEFLGTMIVMFVYGLAHGFNVAHSGVKKRNDEKPGGDGK